MTPFAPHHALFVGLVAYAAAFLARLLGALLDGGDSIPIPFLVASGVIGPLAGLAAGLWRHAAQVPFRVAVRLERPRGAAWGAIPAAVVAGAALAPAAMWATTMLQGAYGPERARALAEANAALEAGGASLLALVAVGSVVLFPVALELLFRGFLQPRLVATMGPWRGVLLALLIQSLLLDATLLPATLLLCIPLAILAHRTQSTWPALAGAVAHQAAPLAFDLAGMPLPDPMGAAVEVSWPVVLAGLAVAALAATLGAWRVGPRLDRDAR